MQGVHDAVQRERDRRRPAALDTGGRQRRRHRDRRAQSWRGRALERQALARPRVFVVVGWAGRAFNSALQRSQPRAGVKRKPHYTPAKRWDQPCTRVTQPGNPRRRSTHAKRPASRPHVSAPKPSPPEDAEHTHTHARARAHAHTHTRTYPLTTHTQTVRQRGHIHGGGGVSLFFSDPIYFSSSLLVRPVPPIRGPGVDAFFGGQRSDRRLVAQSHDVGHSPCDATGADA